MCLHLLCMTACRIFPDPDVFFPQAKVTIVAGGCDQLLRNRFLDAAAIFVDVRTILKPTVGNKGAEFDEIAVHFFQ